jgi:archaellum component FlaC
MTIDERLERLTDRHEALTQSVEILTSDLHEMRGIVVQILGGIEKLATVAENHERRLERLEDSE